MHLILEKMEHSLRDWAMRWRMMSRLPQEHKKLRFLLCNVWKNNLEMMLKICTGKKKIMFPSSFIFIWCAAMNYTHSHMHTHTICSFNLNEFSKFMTHLPLFSFWIFVGRFVFFDLLYIIFVFLQLFSYWRSIWIVFRSFYQWTNTELIHFVVIKWRKRELQTDTVTF